MFSTTSGATEEGFLFCLHVYTDWGIGAHKVRKKKNSS